MSQFEQVSVKMTKYLRKIVLAMSHHDTASLLVPNMLRRRLQLGCDTRLLNVLLHKGDEATPLLLVGTLQPLSPFCGYARTLVALFRRR